jgi:uncharacterized protein YjeT (DUF2065 family)
MEWNDLFAALALVLVIEGLVPFLNPAGARRACEMFMRLNDGQLRTAGVISMLLGAAALYFLRK